MRARTRIWDDAQFQAAFGEIAVLGPKTLGLKRKRPLKARGARRSPFRWARIILFARLHAGHVQR
ncbi:MAG: hypothetical protein DMG31_18485 [Acidobacteria bacterium]|nr:MAG: hypothetical protein DMG31_18485 [Acidobacteriota bacterium]